MRVCPTGSHLDTTVDGTSSNLPRHPTDRFGTQLVAGLWRGLPVLLKPLDNCLDQEGNEVDFTRVERMVTLWTHPNIPQCLGLTQLCPQQSTTSSATHVSTDASCGSRANCLVYERMATSAHAVLKVRRHGISVPKALQWIGEAARALCYLHACRPPLLFG